jgi:HPt (histidine-containing phosphotransfer) domain-containing protein
MKGSCANLSASASSKCAAAIEILARAGDLAGSQDELRKFNQELTRLFDLLSGLGKKD